MPEQILLSTYQIRIRNRRSDTDQNLNQFNGVNDLYDELGLFFHDLLVEAKRLGNDEERGTQLAFGVDSLPIFNPNERTIYGVINAGVLGKDLNIRDFVQNVLAFRGRRDQHGIYNDIFFYIKLPRNKPRGYLILQRRSKFGVKTAFTNLLRAWIRDRGYQDSIVSVNPIMNSEVFRLWINNGNLKKINFIQNSIPEKPEDYFINNEQPNTVKGQFTQTVKSNIGLNPYWKNFASGQFFKRSKNATVELDADNEIEFHEIEFEVELNRHKKKFFARSKQRAVPDLDVTQNLQYDDNGNPTIETLIAQSQEIIRETFEFNLDG